MRNGMCKAFTVICLFLFCCTTFSAPAPLQRKEKRKNGGWIEGQWSLMWGCDEEGEGGVEYSLQLLPDGTMTCVAMNNHDSYYIGKWSMNGDRVTIHEKHRRQEGNMYYYQFTLNMFLNHGGVIDGGDSFNGTKLRLVKPIVTD